MEVPEGARAAAPEARPGMAVMRLRRPAGLAMQDMEGRAEHIIMMGRTGLKLTAFMAVAAAAGAVYQLAPGVMVPGAYMEVHAEQI